MSRYLLTTTLECPPSLHAAEPSSDHRNILGLYDDLPECYRAALTHMGDNPIRPGCYAVVDLISNKLVDLTCAHRYLPH